MKKLFILLIIIILQNCFAINAVIVNVLDRTRFNFPPNGKIEDKDPRHFQGTPVWEMAKAIYFYEYGTLEDLLKKDNQFVNHQEKFIDLSHRDASLSLLDMAVFYKREGAVKILLTYGADPNKGNAREIAVSQFYGDDDILEILLKNGTDPNNGWTKEKCKNTKDVVASSMLSDPAYDGNMYRVKLLVKYGANPNLCYGLPMENAINKNNYDIAYYLLESGGYDPRTSLNPHSKYWDIRSELRLKVHPLGTNLHREKMEFVKLLKEKGLDYFKYPTERALYSQKTYPDNWMEYLENY